MIRARSEKYKRMMLELGHCCEGKTEEERTELELEVKPQGVGTQGIGRVGVRGGKQEKQLIKDTQRKRGIVQTTTATA